MRRYLYALLGMSLLASVSGCVTTGVGGGPNVTAGTYSYLTRELEVIYGIPLADVWPRALAAVESLQLHIDRQYIDGLGGEIQARRPHNPMVIPRSSASLCRNNNAGSDCRLCPARLLSSPESRSRTPDQGTDTSLLL